MCACIKKSVCVQTGKMEMPAFPEKVAQQLRSLAQQCMDDPSLLYDPKLSFIKELIEYYGGKIPETKSDDSSHDNSEFKSAPEEPEPEPEPESEESDIELDMTSVIGMHPRPSLKKVVF